MPQTPKQKEKIEGEEKVADQKGEWSKDQQERGYYYDDSHGYEVFDPEKEVDDEEED